MPRPQFTQLLHWLWKDTGWFVIHTGYHSYTLYIRKINFTLETYYILWKDTGWCVFTQRLSLFYNVHFKDKIHIGKILDGLSSTQVIILMILIQYTI